MLNGVILLWTIIFSFYCSLFQGFLLEPYLQSISRLQLTV